MRYGIDAIEWAAVDKENGFVHLRAGEYKGGAHGLKPVWNGAGLRHRLDGLLQSLSAPEKEAT